MVTISKIIAVILILLKCINMNNAEFIYIQDYFKTTEYMADCLINDKLSEKDFSNED